MKRKTILKHGRKVAFAACGLLIGAGMMQSCKDDDLILTGQPSWLGNSIYERLQEDGNFSYTLRLIDDMDQTEVLSHTGSKTLFVAPDSCYERWFKDKNKAWKNVSSYGDLTPAQKKLLLNNSMINNAYLIELMSNGKAQGDAATPEEGRTMRRETATSIYDSVYIMPYDKMPETQSWATYRDRKKSIPLFKDATTAPMIHFLPAFMQYNKITSSDLKKLSNDTTATIADAWVNGKKVVQRDITCKNGYIQIVDGVIESSPNMAEIIRSTANTQMWSKLLDRFSAPYPYDYGMREYNRIYNNEDSAYVLRYFSQRSYNPNRGGEEVLEKTPDDKTVSALLSFDPGWNHYIDASSNSDLHFDAGAMIVPTDQALDDWWNGTDPENSGKALRDEYKTWDNVPDATLSKLLNVNMLSTFSEAVPTKFASVLNDAKESLGIKAEDVVACYMGCNGVVYVTNKVFTPAEYSSVAYPALAHASTMNIIYWCLSGALGSKVGDNDYPPANLLPYLLSMDSRYALMLPTNDAMKFYIDPNSYGTTNTLKDQANNDSIVEAADLIEFEYDNDQQLLFRVQAQRYATTVAPDGTITKTADKPTKLNNSSSNNKQFRKEVEDIVNQLVIVIPDKSKTLSDYVAEGYNYFKTKAGSMVRVTNEGGKLAFEGGWQMEHNHKKIVATENYPNKNGVAYQLEDGMPLTAEKSLYLTLKEHTKDGAGLNDAGNEYAGFMNLLVNDYVNADSKKALFITKLNNKYNSGLSGQGSMNLRLFDNYNYTVYVPTNASINDLQEKGYLPKFSDLVRGNDTDETAIIDSLCTANHWFDYADRTTVRNTVTTAIQGILSNFIRYHVQDHSVAVAMAPEVELDPLTQEYKVKEDNLYENMLRNPANGRFYSLKAVWDQTSLTVTDEVGNARKVITTPGVYNNVCREYWFEGTGRTARLFMASDAVVHLIDGPLFAGYTNADGTPAKNADGTLAGMRPWREIVVEALSNIKK